MLLWTLLAFIGWIIVLQLMRRRDMRKDASSRLAARTRIRRAAATGSKKPTE